MERKEIAHTAIDLIEEALEKPNKTIILEERITKPICEPGMKEPTEKELKMTRDYIIEFIADFSARSSYNKHLSEKLYIPFSPKNFVEYTNNSIIVIRR